MGRDEMIRVGFVRASLGWIGFASEGWRRK
jgi:hypothetical protein